jgi:hypothetical protein
VLAEFGAQFANMFAVVLMVAAGITFAAYALTTPRSSANLVLAIGILGPATKRRHRFRAGACRGADG